MRNPKRTARTAAALMVGVSLVTGISVLAASIRSSIRSIIGEQFVGDFVVNTRTQGFGGLPPELATQLERTARGRDGHRDPARPTARSTGKARRHGAVRRRSDDGRVTCSTWSSSRGKASDLTRRRDPGEREPRRQGRPRRWADTIGLTLLDGVERQLTVQGIYEKDELAGPYTISDELFRTSGSRQVPLRRVRHPGARRERGRRCSPP